MRIAQTLCIGTAEAQHAHALRVAQQEADLVEQLAASLRDLIAISANVSCKDTHGTAHTMEEWNADIYRDARAALAKAAA
jgi:hypothetical protein